MNKNPATERPATTSASRKLGRMIADRRRPGQVMPTGMTQRTLSRIVDVDQSLVSKWEHGLVVPSLANLRTLSRALDLNFEAMADLAMQAADQRKTAA